MITLRAAAGLETGLHGEARAVVIHAAAAGLDARLDLESRVRADGLHVRLPFSFCPEANPETAAGVPRAEDDEDGGFRGSEIGRK